MWPATLEANSALNESRDNPGVRRVDMVCHLPRFEGPYRIPPARAGEADRSSCASKGRDVCQAELSLRQCLRRNAERINPPMFESAGRAISLPTPTAAHAAITVPGLAPQAFVTRSLAAPAPLVPLSQFSSGR